MQNVFSAAEILLPDLTKIDGQKWAVIACDQFTSEPSYWGEVRSVVGTSASTLGMILPEAYLSEASLRIPEINRTMKEYLDAGILTEHTSAMLYVERTQSDGNIRRGIVGMIDLEKYEYTRGSVSPIRATEETVLERIPPRTAIRKDAPLELPHIMALIDDPNGTVIEPLANSASKYELAYDFDLMCGGGHIRGAWIPALEQNRILHALDVLTTPDSIKVRYGEGFSDPLVLAVGDGNHSLAAAKAVYEQLKQEIGSSAKSHPARYALCEIVNLHDPAIQFEPIYRVLFHVNPEDVVHALTQYANQLNGDETPQAVQYLSECLFGEVVIEHPTQQLTVGTLQSFLDQYTKEHPEATIDYIHGEDSLRSLANQGSSIGFLFSGMQKDQLFTTVMKEGALPRKTFSMGNAQDKRYYLECRRIK